MISKGTTLGHRCALPFLLVAILAFLAQARVMAQPLVLHVSGSDLVNSNGATVVLHGVNIPSLETLNTGTGPASSGNPSGGGGTGIMDSVNEAINVWHVSLIRLPICQDRWLGYAPVDYNGYSNSASTYQGIVEQIVSTASAAGVYVLIDMHWSDEGVWGENLGQHMMPDENTATAWTSVATEFANNPAVLFDAYNEPYPTSWSIWLNGGTVDDTVTYTSPGMQGIVNTIRATGANNVIVVGGISYSGDLTGIANGYAISGSNIMYSPTSIHSET
jgi:aryl-phospho-beta-D-glucosidase BglC (GH1 family)